MSGINWKTAGSSDGATFHDDEAGGGSGSGQKAHVLFQALGNRQEMDITWRDPGAS